MTVAQRIDLPMGIGGCIARLNAGSRMARRGWKGQGMYLELQIPDAHSKMTKPYVYMKTTDGNYVPFQFSQDDVLAEDWVLIAGENK